MELERPLHKVQSLGLPQLGGTVPTYHVLGQASRAQLIQSMLEDAVVFFQDHLGVFADLSFALLGPTEWSVVSGDIPYGLPWVSDAPYITVFPATLDHPMGRLIMQNIAQSDTLLNLPRSHEHIADDFISLIGFHELGHVITEHYGIKPPTHWVSELLASFIAYAFMKVKQPHQATLWDAVCELFPQVITPHHTTLTDFEALYAGVGFENYLWYQGLFQRRVCELYQAHGLDFLPMVKHALTENGGPQDTDPLFLATMEQISPGFQTWVHHNRLM